jgi:hypothetical protein
MEVPSDCGGKEMCYGLSHWVLGISDCVSVAEVVYRKVGSGGEHTLVNPLAQPDNGRTCVNGIKFGGIEDGDTWTYAVTLEGYHGLTSVTFATKGGQQMGFDTIPGPCCGCCEGTPTTTATTSQTTSSASISETTSRSTSRTTWRSTSETTSRATSGTTGASTSETTTSIAPTEEWCTQREITLTRCIGHCGLTYQQVSPMSVPAVLGTDVYMPQIEQLCLGCQGQLQSLMVPIECDDGSLHYLRVYSMTNCECQRCQCIW